jgi:hypothetical protein
MHSKSTQRPARRFALLIGLVLMLAPGLSRARPASVGYYAEAGIGALTFLGKAGDYSRVGPSFEVRAGYDLFPWLAVGLHLGASTHEAMVPPPPEGEYFQLYSATADARLGTLVGRWGLFADGGVGLGMMSSNILARVAILEPGERSSFLYRAGGGIEYQLQNRHYAFGMAGQWMSMPGFDSTHGVATRIYLRYTY